MSLSNEGWLGEVVSSWFRQRAACCMCVCVCVCMFVCLCVCVCVCVCLTLLCCSSGSSRPSGRVRLRAGWMHTTLLSHEGGPIGGNLGNISSENSSHSPPSGETRRQGTRCVCCCV